MSLINLTPHSVVIRTADGDIVLPASGTIARVASAPGPTEHLALVNDYNARIPCVGLPVWGEVDGLPEHQAPGVGYVVSLLVLERLRALQAERITRGEVGPCRTDVFAPATGPADGCDRGPSGQVLAVRKLLALNPRG